MQWILLATALTAAGGLATVRLALRDRREHERRRREEAAFETRLADRTRILNDRLVRLEQERRGLADADDRKARLLVTLDERMRGPLNAIRGFADLMQARADSAPGEEGLSHRQGQALGQIAAATARLIALADAVSDLARAETGRLDLRIERLDAVLMLRLAVEDLQPQARAAGVWIHAPEPSPGLGVMADRRRLDQVLKAMIVRALTRTPRGAVVAVEARAGRRRLCFVVRDGGAPGTPDEVAALLRPLAEDGDPATLGVARRLAEAMGGRLGPSDAGEAVSALALDLPAAPGGATKQNALPPATLLYVDADPAAVSLMRRVLAGLGPVTLHAAASGAEGLALARTLKPDLVVTELILPDMEGFDLCAALAADPVTRGAPVLALSARIGPETWRRARDAGLSACLAKPAEITVLARTLACALSGVLSGVLAKTGTDVAA